MIVDLGDLATARGIKVTFLMMRVLRGWPRSLNNTESHAVCAGLWRDRISVTTSDTQYHHT